MVDRIIDGKVSLGELNGTVLRAGYTGAVVMDYALPNVPLIETAHAPTIRKLLDTDSLTLSKSAVRMLSRPLLLPAHSPALLESWQVLAEGLKPEDEVVITQRQLKAYLIGDALLQHTALPYGERLRAVGVALDAQVMVEGKLVEVETYLIDEYGDPVKVHKDKKVPQLFLKGALNATRKRIEQAVSHQPKNLEEAQQGLAATDLLIDFYGSEYHTFWVAVQTEKTKWFEDVTLQGQINYLNDNQFTQKLLMEEQLAMKPSSETRLWVSVFCRSLLSETFKKGNGPGELADFFLTHPKLQTAFWHTVHDLHSPPDSDVTTRVFSQLPEKYRVQAEALNLRATYVAIPDRIINWFYSQADSSDLEAFITSFEESGVDKNVASNTFGWLVELAAAFKQSNAEHSNVPVLIRSLGAANRAMRIDQGLYVDILADQAPGFLFRDQKAGLKVKQPKNGQSKDQMVAALAARGEMAYLSTAEWKAKQIPDVIEDKPVQVDIHATQVISLPVFGETAMVNPLDRSKVLGHLNERLNQSKYKMDQDRALEIWVEQDSERKETGGKPLVVLTDLIPGYHPLSILKEVGVVGITQTADLMTVVVDSSRMGLASEADKIGLSGPIRNNEANIAFSGEAFQNSTLHLLLNAARQFGLMKITDQVLDKPELSEVRSTVKSHNVVAKRDGLPQVEFIEDPSKRKEDSSLTVTLVGKKPVFLVLA